MRVQKSCDCVKESSSALALQETFQTKSIKIQQKSFIELKGCYDTKQGREYKGIGWISYLVGKLLTSARETIPSDIITRELWECSGELIYSELCIIMYQVHFGFEGVSPPSLSSLLLSYSHLPKTHQMDGQLRKYLLKILPHSLRLPSFRKRTHNRNALQHTFRLSKTFQSIPNIPFSRSL